jgi:putative thioredoxin
MTTSTSTFEVQDFHKEVIEASHEQPILVDFWAPWCGPCQMLGPALENMAQQAEGRWKLAKVNVDNNAELAQQYGVRGIPKVLLFKDGEGVDSFSGVMPEHQIKKWLEQYVPNEISEEAEAAYQQFLDGNQQKAKEQLEQLHTQEPGNKDVKIRLGEIVLFDYPDYARELMQKIHEGDEQHQKAEAIKTIADLLYFNENPEVLEDSPAKTDFEEGVKALGQQNFETSVQKFIKVVEQDKTYQDEMARKGCIAIFNFLGNDHAVTQQYRKQFDRALY